MWKYVDCVCADYTLGRLVEVKTSYLMLHRGDLLGEMFRCGFSGQLHMQRSWLGLASASDFLCS